MRSHELKEHQHFRLVPGELPVQSLRQLPLPYNYIFSQKTGLNLSKSPESSMEVVDASISFCLAKGS